MSIRVGQSLKQIERYHQDKEYRAKHDKYCDEYRKKHKRAVNEYQRSYRTELTNFKDKHCKNCNKLLYYKTEGDYCRKCWRKFK